MSSRVFIQKSAPPRRVLALLLYGYLGHGYFQKWSQSSAGSDWLRTTALSSVSMLNVLEDSRVVCVPDKGRKRDINRKKGKACKKVQIDPVLARPTNESRRVKPAANVSVKTSLRGTGRREGAGGKWTMRAGDPAEFPVKYRQQERLGAGGSSSVFKGVRRSDQLPVAIKRIFMDAVEFLPLTIMGKVHDVPKEVVLMCRAGAGPRSVGCGPSVSLLDWYKLNKEVVLVMERPTPVMDLFDHRVAHGPLSEQNAKEITLQLVQALVDLHKRGVFHRDIKMENVLIQDTPSGPRVQIIDFGCGAIVQSRHYTRFYATVHFAPPECLNNQNYHAGPTSVWQVGTLLYDLLGSKRFTTVEFMKGKVTCPPRLSQDCQDFLERCLTVDPEERIALNQLLGHRWFQH